MMRDPPTTAHWRRGFGGPGRPPHHVRHPTMHDASLSRFCPAASLSAAEATTRPISHRSPSPCVLSVVRSPPPPRAGLPPRAASASTCCSSSASGTELTSRGRLGSASSLAPSRQVAGFGLGASRGATDYMPFALSQDVEFFRQYVKSTERKPRPRAPERPPPTGLVSRAQVFPPHIDVRRLE